MLFIPEDIGVIKEYTIAIWVLYFSKKNKEKVIRPKKNKNRVQYFQDFGGISFFVQDFCWHQKSMVITSMVIPPAWLKVIPPAWQRCRETEKKARKETVPESSRGDPSESNMFFQFRNFLFIFFWGKFLGNISAWFLKKIFQVTFALKKKHLK